VAADAVVAEDTRVAGKLLSRVGVKKRVLRLDEHATASQIRAVLAEVKAGKQIVVTSDAGTPGVSDPGAALVDMAHAEGLEVDSVPGPSAASNALALSGFYAQKYSFLGFLARRAGALRSELEQYRTSSTTLVVFESPHRVRETLRAAQEVLGDRRAAVCREMTKVHQGVYRGRISELLGLDLPEKGEYTLVIEGWRKQG
jgi:16S rRNA (cytidine1402-2'-O)-methyltransferase